MKASVGKVIDEFSALIPEEQEFVMNIFSKMIVESKREAIAKASKKVIANYSAGKVKRGDSSDLFRDLEHY
jgi:hypothetical protein